MKHFALRGVTALALCLLLLLQASAMPDRLIPGGNTVGMALELDGVSVEYPTWWFNVRCSNTEPLVRLNLESTKSVEEMEAKRDEVLALIRQ